VNLTSCNYIKSNNASKNENVNPVNTPIKERKSRAYQDITELSNKIKAEKEQKELKNIKKPKVNILENAAETDCPNCNTKTSSTYNCPTCQKEMCLLCAMTSIDIKGNILHLCEECWTNDAEIKIEDSNVSMPIKDLKEDIKEETGEETEAELEVELEEEDILMNKDKKSMRGSAKYKRNNKKL
jgi:hypothetical protein